MTPEKAALGWTVRLALAARVSFGLDGPGACVEIAKGQFNLVLRMACEHPEYARALLTSIDDDGDSERINRLIAANPIVVESEVAP